MRKLTLVMMMLLLICPAASAEMFFIQEVIDGNTLKLLNGETVRLIGVDIPEIQAEMTDKEKLRITKIQQKAAEYVRSLVSGAKADLQFDTKERDAEGNILAYAWFLYPADNVKEALEFRDDFLIDEIIEDWGEHQYVTFLNAAIIKAGYGVPIEEKENIEHVALFNSIYQQKALPTLQVKSLDPNDLTKVAN